MDPEVSEVKRRKISGRRHSREVATVPKHTSAGDQRAAPTSDMPLTAIFSGLVMQIPYHRQWEYEDIDIQDQYKKVLNDPNDVHIDAVSSHNGLTPGICNGCALECRRKCLRHADSTH